MTAPIPSGPSPVGGGPAVSQARKEFLADIGDRIRAERLARGWTQPHLGQRSSLPAHAIKHMENGDTVLPLLSLVDVCRGLGIAVSDLLSESWVMPERFTPARAALTPLQVRILQAAVPGVPLARVAAVVGVSREAVGARLSEAYRVLGVGGVPRGEARRAAAVRVARERGLLDASPDLHAA